MPAPRDPVLKRVEQDVTRIRPEALDEQRAVPKRNRKLADAREGVESSRARRAPAWKGR